MILNNVFIFCTEVFVMCDSVWVGAWFNSCTHTHGDMHGNVHGALLCGFPRDSFVVSVSLTTFGHLLLASTFVDFDFEIVIERAEHQIATID